MELKRLRGSQRLRCAINILSCFQIVIFVHFEDEMFLRRRGFVTPLFSIGGTTRVILRSHRCTKGFLNYFNAIIKFLKVVFKG